MSLLIVIGLALFVGFMVGKVYTLSKPIAQMSQTDLHMIQMIIDMYKTK
jgi:hypothetical protein